MRVAGFVLAGGASGRMGRDKALLPFAGATLVEFVAAVVHETAGSVAIVGRPEEFDHLGITVLGEEFPGCGPLSGIEAALRQMSADWALVTACDMPGLTQSWLRLLIATAARSECDAVVTSNSKGQWEPLLALYHARLHADVRKALVDGRFAVRELIAGWRVEFVGTSDLSVATNVNTPEEWAAWSR